MIVREVDIFTTVAHVYDSDIPAALELLAESNIAAVDGGSRGFLSKHWSRRACARSRKGERTARSSSLQAHRGRARSARSESGQRVFGMPRSARPPQEPGEAPLDGAS